jgi:hypothetical protein
VAALDMLKSINPKNPYGIQAQNMGRFGLVPTTRSIDKMANWDIKNREIELQEAARRANDALNFYNIQDIPDMITPDNPYYLPLTGAVGQGLVPTNLFQSAFEEQRNMGSNQAVADLVRQFQGMVTPETPQHIQAAIGATAENPDALKGLVDPIFEHFGDVHAAQQQALEDERLAAAERERRENVIRILRELGVSDDIAPLLFEPELKDIVINNIKSLFPDRESQLKIKKLETEIEKTEADIAYTKKRTENLNKAEDNDDERFIKEFRARYQSYLRTNPIDPMSEEEFARVNGKEVYDRYNKLLNPARGESTGVPSGSSIQQAENLERQFGGIREAILSVIYDPNIPEETLEVLMDKYNKQHGTNYDKNTWSEEWAKANNRDPKTGDPKTGKEKKPFIQINWPWGK